MKTAGWKTLRCAVVIWSVEISDGVVISCSSDLCVSDQ
jgi:hypothetical protein